MAGYSNATATTPTPHAYALPVLSHQEIASILSESQIINVPQKALTNPTHDDVIGLYIALLCHLDPLQEDPSQVAFSALERLENPDNHVGGIRDINLYTKIKDLLLAIQCPLNFTLADLLRPDPNRTLKHLSAIINFLLHKDSKLSMLRPYEEELGVLEDESKQRETEILQLKEEIAAIKEAGEMEKPQVLEAEAKVKELQQNLDNLNTLQSNMNKERQAMKEKVHEMENNVRRSDLELIQVSQENAVLRSEVVPAPDELQRALEEKKVVRIMAKDSERLDFQTFQEKTTILEAYTKASQKMTKQLAQTQAVQEKVNSSKSVEKDVKQLKAKLSDEQMLDKSLEAKVVEYQAKAEQLDEQNKLVEKEAKLRREKDRRELDNVKMEAEQCRHDLETRRRKIEAVAAEVDAIKAKIVSTKDLAAATQEELLKKGEEIVNELNLYTSSTAQVMSNMEELENKHEMP